MHHFHGMSIRHLSVVVSRDQGQLLRHHLYYNGRWGKSQESQSYARSQQCEEGTGSRGLCKSLSYLYRTPTCTNLQLVSSVPCYKLALILSLYYLWIVWLCLFTLQIYLIKTASVTSSVLYMACSLFIDSYSSYVVFSLVHYQYQSFWSQVNPLTNQSFPLHCPPPERCSFIWLVNYFWTLTNESWFLASSCFPGPTS